MVREPFAVITIALGPLGVAALERENPELACEMRGRVGDAAGDERRGPSSRFSGPISLDARSRPAATASSGLALASRGVRATAVRMPRTVHNQGTGGRRLALPVEAVPRQNFGPFGPMAPGLTAAILDFLGRDPRHTP
jgi:hypothetical protein